MKQLKIIVTVLFCMTGISGCHFLEVDRVGKSDIANFFSEFSALQASLNGSYSLLYELYDKSMLAYPEVAGDLLYLSSEASQWETKYNFTSVSTEETTAVGNIWKQSYSVILNINHLIQYAPALKDGTNDNSINDILAQAYFIRALAHFCLCQTYSQTYTYTPDASHIGIPIMTGIPVVTDKMKRNSVKEVYAQIIADINKALSLFSPQYKFNEYLASPASCKALMARVLLYMNDYRGAVGYSSALMSEFSLTSHKDYRKMFVSTATRGGESIFRLNGYEHSRYQEKLYDYHSPMATPSAKLKALFKDRRDVRRTLLSHRAYDPELKKVVDYEDVCMKFYCTDSVADIRQRHYDPFMFRVSEMYLIFAEASLHLGDEKKAENAIRALEARALGVEPSSVTIEYSTKEELDALIMEERMKELCFEGHRLFDIARRHEMVNRDYKTNAALRNLKFPDYRFVLPIPQLELESNKKIMQNPSN